MQRRDFLLIGIGGIVISGTVPLALMARESPKIQVLDTHIHFFDETRPDRGRKHEGRGRGHS